MRAANPLDNQIRQWVRQECRRRFLLRTEGAQLVEFAFILPLLAVMLVATWDFGAGFVLQDRLTNAVREGARVGASQPSDLTNGTPPPSVTAVRNAVANYLTNAGVTTCTIDSAPSKDSNFGKWHYSSSSSGCSSMELEIERATQGSSGCTIVSCTKVTLHYPYSWHMGNVIKMIKPGASYPNPLILSSVEFMPNLS